LKFGNRQAVLIAMAPLPTAIRKAVIFGLEPICGRPVLIARASQGRSVAGVPAPECPLDEGAYTVRTCAGRPLGAKPDNLQPTPRNLSLDEIDAVVAYLQARIVGHGKITHEECLTYYEGKEDCDDIK
jgi:hypothetical protein